MGGECAQGNMGIVAVGKWSCINLYYTAYMYEILKNKKLNIKKQASKQTSRHLACKPDDLNPVSSKYIEVPAACNPSAPAAWWEAEAELPGNFLMQHGVKNNRRDPSSKPRQRSMTAVWKVTVWPSCATVWPSCACPCALSPPPYTLNNQLKSFSTFSLILVIH